MHGELHGKVAVVTGAATGLGLFITLRYILEGMNVVADYVGELPKEFEDVQAKHADRVKFVKADVSNEEDIKALAETALKEFGHVDIWVNNAGVEASFPTIDMPLKEWQRVIDVNLNGVFLGSREALRIFRDQKIKGSIINMSSVHQRIPWPTFAHFTMRQVKAQPKCSRKQSLWNMRNMVFVPTVLRLERLTHLLMLKNFPIPNS
ncbi:glucose 1-dehydrogenase 1 [Enterococcus sp. DIV1758]